MASSWFFILRGILCLAEELFASQQGHWSTQFVIVTAHHRTSSCIGLYKCFFFRTSRVEISVQAKLHRQKFVTIILTPHPPVTGNSVTNAFLTSCLNLLVANNLSTGGTRWRSWLRHCATNQKVVGSIPDGDIILPAALWPWG